MRKLGLVFLLAVAFPAAASDLSLQLRHRSAHTTSNVLDSMGTVVFPILPWLEGEAGARLSLSTTDLEALDYKGELRARPLSFFELGLRVFQSNRFGDGTAFSQWFAFTTLTAWPLSFLGVTGTFGWHQRHVILRGNVGLPVFANAAFIDRDFAARIGFLLRPAERWLAQLGISTFEDFDIFNLNSPFAYVGVEHRLAESRWTLSAFGRYRLLLGFGRRDELMIGVGLKSAI